jgi:hypothetical protein
MRFRTVGGHRSEASGEVVLDLRATADPAQPVRMQGRPGVILVDASSSHFGVGTWPPSDFSRGSSKQESWSEVGDE